MLPLDIDINGIKNRQRSIFLTECEAKKILSVANNFCDLGLMPTHHITINFQREIEGAMNNPSFKIQPYISSLINKMRKWHVQHKIPFAYLWVVENTSHDYVGHHVHILLHTSMDRFDDLNSMITSWLPFERDDLNNPKRKHTNININKNNFHDFWGLVHYLLKGIDPRLDKTVVKTKQTLGRQGYILGSRYSYSKKPYIPIKDKI